MKLRLLMPIFLVCGATLPLRAQGPPQYLWTWNGDSGLFQGSFETTAGEMQPGAVVLNGLFDLSINGPDRGWVSNLGTGDHTMFTYDDSNSFGITIYGPNGVQLGSNPLAMSEELGNMTIFGELGSWSITEIPEPSAAALLTLGGIAWFVRRRPLFSARRPR
jgi:hypothetical protein